MAGDRGRRAGTGCCGEISADGTSTSLLEASSHSRCCTGGRGGWGPVPTISSSRTHSDRIAWYVCTDFPLQWSHICRTRQGSASAIANRTGGACRVDDCKLGKKGSARVAPGCICLANGGIALLRACRIPLVSSLAAAIPDISLDAVAHRLDREHH